MATRRTEREIKYDQPYDQTEPGATGTARRTWTENPPPDAVTRTRPEPAMAETGRRMPEAPPVAEGTERMAFADRVSGGPVWSGFLVGFATWIVLEVFLVAVGLTVLRAGEGSTIDRSAWWWSAGAGLIALFVGGLVAGIASRWRTASAGALQGLTVWALSFVALLVLGAVGAGIGFGAFSDVVSVNAGISGQQVPASVIDTAQDAAGVAVLGLVATAITAVAGGVIGARLASRPPKGSGARSGEYRR